MNFLAREYPDLVDGYQQLHARKYAPQAYIAEVRGYVATLQRRFGLRPRRTQPHVTSSGTPSSKAEATQTEFRWGDS